MVKFANAIVFVKDIDVSKRFYIDIIGLNMIDDYETIVFFENRFVIHSAKSIIHTVYKKDLPGSDHEQGKRNILIYFESDDLEGMYQKIEGAGVRIIHGIEKQAWGQRVFRFYDPDDHMVEIGEPFRLDF
jgi:catechol 2,3-dioxygenase-like lactoylglutathione lyase family enzyme